MLTDLYPPSIGGLEQYVQRLARELAHRGHDVGVATLHHPGLAWHEVDAGVSVHRLRGVAPAFGGLYSNPQRRFAPPLPDPGVTIELQRLLADHCPTIVHAHNWMVHSFLPLKPWSGAKLVVSLHDYSLVCANKSLLRGGVSCGGPAPAKCVRCAVSFYGPARGLPTVIANWGMSPFERAAVDVFLPVSTAVARGSGLDRSRLRYRVIPNFVCDDNATTSAEIAGYQAGLPSEPFLLFVGNLGHYKGLDVLLEAYRGLTAAPPLVLIGPITPDTPTSLPDNVVMLNDWPHAAVLGAWRRSLIGLVPSVWAEPCPTVALEAMAAGKPVVGSAVGGLPDLVVHGETGLLVAPGDVAALRAAMQRLLTEPDLRERMGRAAMSRASTFRATNVVGRIEAVYRELEAGPC